MTSIKPLIAGNWKMNGVRASTAEIHKMNEAVSDGALVSKADLMVFPPATLVMAFAHILQQSPINIGGQDCHSEASGAFTGDISAQMLADAGARAVILGHSERRSGHGERDRDVQAKAAAAHAAGLNAIVCVGETQGERRLGLTLPVISRQLRGSVPSGASSANTTIAYEPVWAIGTGLTPSNEEIAEVHRYIRAQLVEMLGEENGRAIRLLYGGSVKPENAAEILSIADVNGALVGGASLKAESFLKIAAACPDA